MRIGKDTLISSLADSYREASGTAAQVKAGELSSKISEMPYTVNTKGVILDAVKSNGRPRRVIIRGLEEIGRYAFDASDNPTCSEIEEVVLEDPVTFVAASSFRGLTNLCNVDSLFSSPCEFSSKIFSGCSSLTEVNISAKPTEDFGSVFYGCDNLETIRVSFGEDEVSGAPWGAAYAEIIYNWTGGEE